MATIYIRAGEHAVESRDIQLKACERIVEQYGLDDPRSVRKVLEASTEAQPSLAALLKNPPDVLVVQHPGVLSDSPSEVLRIVIELTNAGTQVLCATPPGEIDVPTLRAYVEAFAALERKAVIRAAEIIRMQREHEREMDEAIAQYDAKMLPLLQEHGVTLRSLIGAAGQANGTGQPAGLTDAELDEIAAAEKARAEA